MVSKVLPVETGEMNTYLFVNPASGRYSVDRFRSISGRLEAVGRKPEIFQVRTPAEIRAHCHTINSDPQPHLVVIAAGDGTFNAAVNGLLPGTATLAVLPLGTSNVLAAEIGINSVEEGIERIAAGETRSLPVGLLELENSIHRFVLMAGIGLDGAVVRDVWSGGKRLLRQGAYVLSAVQAALEWDTSDFEITASGACVTCHSLIVCNASRYGGNFVLTPDNTLFSEGLMAVCVTNNQRRTYLRIAYDLFRGKSADSKKLLRLPFTQLIITGKKPIQIDGDFVGYGPAKISELRDFARIIV
jgi:diacylglycerol kinase family enzyme